MGKLGKIEAGQGGKLGHGNMSHWEGTEEIKYRTKRKRRTQDKNEVRKGTHEREIERST